MHGFGVVCLLLVPSVFARAQVPPVPAGPPAQALTSGRKNGSRAPHALEASDLESFLDGIMPLAAGTFRRGRVLRCWLCRTAMCCWKGLWICGPEEQKAGRSCYHHLSPGIDFETIYLGFCHATGRAGKTRS